MAEDPEWPVQIFRKSDTYGWQLLDARCPVVVEAKASVTGKNKNTATTTAAARGKTRSKAGSSSLIEKRTLSKPVKLLASPRVGSIIVRRVRLRISIYPNSTVVTRRRNALMIETKGQGARVLLMRFSDVPSCRAFSDHFVRLNPMRIIREYQQKQQQQSQPQQQLQELSVQGVTRSQDHSQPSTHKKGIISAAARKKKVATGRTPTNASSGSKNNVPPGGDQGGSSRDRQLVISYIYRLMQSPDFLEYTNRLEATLISAPEGKQMIRDLANEGDSRP